MVNQVYMYLQCGVAVTVQKHAHTHKLVSCCSAVWVTVHPTVHKQQGVLDDGVH
jgi:hypothetical protein